MLTEIDSLIKYWT